METVIINYLHFHHTFSGLIWSHRRLLLIIVFMLTSWDRDARWRYRCLLLRMFVLCTLLCLT